MPHRSRRQFLAELAGGALGFGLVGCGQTGVVSAAPPAAGSTAAMASGMGSAAEAPQVVIFSKHLQWLDYGPMAALAARMGFDGVDLTVRPRGHVLPERVEDDLPRAVEAAREAGIDVPSMTTAINDPDDPLTERILKTASEHGITCYRLGYWTYDLDRPIAGQLDGFRDLARGLADMNAHYGLCGDYQNHAGARYVGASIWDLWEIIKELDPRYMGCQFDARHATVEGGTTWPILFDLVSDRLHTVVAKDFEWRHEEEGWAPANVPLGQGAVDFETYVPMLKASGFSGTVIVHYEYPLGGANHGAEALGIPEALFRERVETDLTQVRYWLEQAGF